MIQKYDKTNPPKDRTVAFCRFEHPMVPGEMVTGVCRFRLFDHSWETAYQGKLVNVFVDYFIDQTELLIPNKESIDE